MRDSICVCSFVFNTPHIIFDDRSTQDRLRYPKVLDIVFADVITPSLELDLSAIHDIKAENRTQQKRRLVTSLT